MSRTRRLPKVLSEEEQRRFLEEFNTRYPTPHRHLCLVRLVLEAGLRVGEAVGLKPEHLDMTTCQLVIREGKGAKDRVLWIGDDLRDLIGEWLERRPDSPWLFPTREGTQVQTRCVRFHPKYGDVERFFDQVEEHLGLREAEPTPPSSPHPAPESGEE